jgi:hypothetical protein
MSDKRYSIESANSKTQVLPILGTSIHGIQYYTVVGSERLDGE